MSIVGAIFFYWLMALIGALLAPIAVFLMRSGAGGKWRALGLVLVVLAPLVIAIGWSFWYLFSVAGAFIGLWVLALAEAAAYGDEYSDGGYDGW